MTRARAATPTPAPRSGAKVKPQSVESADRPLCPPDIGLGIKSPGAAEWHADHATREELAALSADDVARLRYCLGVRRPGETFPI